MAISLTMSEVEGESVSYAPTIFASLAKWLRVGPHRTAIISTHQTPDHLSELTGRAQHHSSETNGSSSNYLNWTYEELHNAALRVVSGLLEQGVGPGSTVVTIMPNNIEWIILYWASFVGKFAICPLDFGIITPTRAAELVNVLSVVAADAVFVLDAKGVNAADEAQLSTRKQLRCKVVLDPSATPPKGWSSLVEHCSPPVSIATKEKIEEEAQHDDVDRPALIVFTSGTTTGVPKGCARTVLSMLHSAACQVYGYDYGPSTRHSMQSQNFRIIAPSICLRTWQIGGGIVMPGAGFLPNLFLDAIEMHKITSMILVPAMVHILTAHKDFESTDRNSVTTIIIGGDIITRDIYEKTCRAFPSAEVGVGHGMSEGGGMMKWPFMGKDKNTKPEIPWYASIAPLGKVSNNTKLRVVDEKNNLVKRGDVGELHISNPSIVRFYLGGLKPEDFYVDESAHWFKSGDIGRIDEEGFVFILGRKKDIVKRAGVSIMPAGLECCIDEFLKSTTSVIAIPHPVLGQEPFAVVQDLHGKSKQEVEKQIVDYFGKDSALGGVATLADLGLDKFPLNKTEKIVKRELEAPVATYLATSSKASSSTSRYEREDAPTVPVNFLPGP